MSETTNIRFTGAQKLVLLSLILGWVSLVFPFIMLLRVWSSAQHPLYLKIGCGLAVIFPFVALVLSIATKKKLKQETGNENNYFDNLFLIISIISLIICGFFAAVGLSI